VIEVALYPADESGCGHYRMRLPAEHAGVLTSFHSRTRLRTSANEARGVVELHHVDVGDADVVVFQRPVDQRLVPVIMQLKAQGVATVVEIDDDLTALDSAHSSFRGLHPRTNPHANWDHLRAACAVADLITVTTPALARRFAGHGRVVVLPNCVPTRLLDSPRNRLLAFEVGWTGTVGTHPRDLDVLGDAIRVLRDEGVSFGVVGDGALVPERLGLDDVLATGWLPIDEYYERMAEFAVGVVPLANSAFNHAKSDLKGVEFAALGVPFVASPLPEYQGLAARGVGRLATKPKRWRTQIRELLSIDRTEVVETGREYVRAHRTIEAQAWRWAEAWEKAVETRKRAGRKVLV
jgi:hypothetical protein